MLEPLGCRLVTARSGEEALKALLREDFAVILLDVQMPGMDGFQTAELINQRERSRDVPIIFVTAIEKQRHQVFRGYSAGAVDYLLKPFDPVVLRSKVGVFVELYERRRLLAESEDLLRTMFEDAPIGMARADAEGRLRHVNPALCETLGLEDSALVGRTLDDLGPVDEADVDAAQRRDLLAGEVRRYEFERSLLARGGVAIPVQVNVSLARGPAGAAPDLILQVQDIRDRHRAERRREQLIRAQAARAQAEALSERLRVTESLSGAALGAEDLDELLAELVERVLEALGADRAVLVLSDEEEVVVAEALVGEEPEIHHTDRSAVDGVAERVAEARAPVTIEDVPGAGLDEILLGDVTSLAAVPLTAAGVVIGSLHVGTTGRRRFDGEAIDLLRLAADRAGLAVARTRLFERERRIAHELQRALLPKHLPDIPGVTMCARYEPGADGTVVGGDWYDAVALPGGRVAVAIGDVVGRGVEAAATMGQLRSALRAFFTDAVNTGTTADRLNRFALGLRETTMTTVVLAILEPATGILRYANAGHPPPIIVSPDGSARLLEGERSPPLAVVHAPAYPEHTAQMEPGSTLILYTDGLVERPQEILDEGLDRLLAAAEEEEVGDVDALCDRLLQAGPGAHPARCDDVTLLAVHAEPKLAARVHLEVTGERPALAGTRELVRRWLRESGARPEQVQDITMACNEACQNAIEHAYALTPDAFAVELERSGREIVVTIRDRGCWSDGDGVPGRGRGLELMRALMDDVQIDSGPAGSTVRMTTKLSATPAAPRSSPDAVHTASVPRKAARRLLRAQPSGAPERGGRTGKG